MTIEEAEAITGAKVAQVFDSERIEGYRFRWPGFTAIFCAERMPLDDAVKMAMEAKDQWAFFAPK